ADGVGVRRNDRSLQGGTVGHLLVLTREELHHNRAPGLAVLLEFLHLRRVVPACLIGRGDDAHVRELASERTHGALIGTAVVLVVRVFLCQPPAEIETLAVCLFQCPVRDPLPNLPWTLCRLSQLNHSRFPPVCVIYRCL